MIDHILVSSESIPAAAHDAVHVNTGLSDKGSDHDPIVARLAVPLTTTPGDGQSRFDSARFELAQNAPNPFTSSTTLSYLLPHPGPVQLRIFNTAGQLVRTLENGHRTGGPHRLAWEALDQNGRQVGNGIYSYQLRTATTTLTGRMVLNR